MLTDLDMFRLRWYQLQYIARAEGFSKSQAKHLCFIAWLYSQGRIS